MKESKQLVCFYSLYNSTNEHLVYSPQILRFLRVVDDDDLVIIVSEGVDDVTATSPNTDLETTKEHDDLLRTQSSKRSLNILMTNITMSENSWKKESLRLTMYQPQRWLQIV